MPLLLEKEISGNGRLALWQVEEEETFFLDSLLLDDEEEATLSDMKTHRRREWIVSRYLLHQISQDKIRTRIQKDEAGRPHRINCNRFISLSHSKDLVAAIISDHSVGIDVQNHVERIPSIQHKFVSTSETSFIEKQTDLLAYYHILWGSKESMYKSYGKKELDFKKHMHVYPFELFDSKIEFAGKVEKNEERQFYDLYYQNINNNYLIYCILNK